ncbi:MAG: Fe-S cluster assembly protein SufD [Crocinitomicaceae bacterium]|nr:Fe-S cluster assembly protein SufD [Crocinitomicaceae bacterium]MBK8926833.1 Fe-S cluster assembly protein SufD [Crocinitomicaceae bacterium]
MTTTEISDKMMEFVSSLGVPENKIQRNAYDELIQFDFPTTKDEYWKYTRLTKISGLSLHRSSQSFTAKSDIEKYIREKNYVVIENGKCRADLSSLSLPGIKFTVVASEVFADENKNQKQVGKSHVFTRINEAYFQEEIIFQISTNAIIEEQVQLVFLTTGENVISNPRVKFVSDKSSSCGFNLVHISTSEHCFTNPVITAYLGENSRLTLDKIQMENENCRHISTEQIFQSANSFFQLNTMVLDGGLVRNNVNVSVDGMNAETHLNGAIITTGKTHTDNHTFVSHNVAQCFSNENYKYVLDGSATGVFNGRVIVQQDAQKINAYQKNANILLTDAAQIYSKPELEIYADDVKCSHGSTTGQLDDDAIFYLQARGISKLKATKILVAAFTEEIIGQFKNENIRSLIHETLVEKHGWDEPLS